MKKPYLGYAYEKLYNTVEGLASGEESIQNRIYNAYISNLTRLKQEFKKPDIREYFMLLEKQLESNGHISFTDLINEIEKDIKCQNLTDKYCKEIGKTIVNLFVFISRDFKQDSITEYFDE